MNKVEQILLNIEKMACDYCEHNKDDKINNDGCETCCNRQNYRLDTEIAQEEIVRALISDMPVVCCKDCIKRYTSMCHAKHEQADMDFCSHALSADNQSGDIVRAGDGSKTLLIRETIWSKNLAERLADTE